MGIFRRNPLDRIERKDERLEDKLGKIVAKIASSLSDFKRIIKLDDYERKEIAIEELHDSLTAALQDILVLMEDERTIQDVEDTEQKYDIPDDDALLVDKMASLEHLKEVISSLVDILDENPNISEYKNEYLDAVNKDIAEVEQTFQRMVMDDEKLSEIYKKLS